VDPDDLNPDEVAVLAVNQAFYDAFEARSLPHMDAVWLHSDEVVCTHPGWKPLVGWEAVRQSWASLLQNEEHLQFIVTELAVVLRSDMAVVRASENLLAGGQMRGSVATINVFVRDDGQWRMLAHHGSPVMRS
jgi:ketosteroid isomerase-like protein